MPKGGIGLPLTYVKIEGDSDSDTLTVYYWDSATSTWKPVLRIKGSTGEVLALGDILQNVTVKTASPAIVLQGTESGARTFQVKEDQGAAKITNATDGVDELVVDPASGVVSLARDLRVSKPTPGVRLQGTETGGKELVIRENAGVTEIYDPSTGTTVMTLESHASRHDRGGPDPLDYSKVMTLLLKSASPTLGTGGTLGAAASITPDTGYSRIVPMGVKITVGGTLATGESVTVRVTFNFDDGTSAFVEKTYTATGDDYLTEADLQSLWKNGVGVTSIDVQAASSATATTATVTVQVRGVQH